jgi:hypothetical protein
VFEIALLSRDERIGHAHAMPAAPELRGEVGSDEAGTAGDQVLSHAFDPSNKRAQPARRL